MQLLALAWLTRSALTVQQCGMYGWAGRWCTQGGTGGVHTGVEGTTMVGRRAYRTYNT